MKNPYTPLALFLLLIAFAFTGCDQSSNNRNNASEYAELCFTRSAEMQRSYVWRSEQNQHKTFHTQHELAEYLNLDQSGDGDILFPLISSLVANGWHLAGVSSSSSQISNKNETVIVSDPFTITYHFTRNH